MAAPSVTAQNTRIDAADAGSVTANIGGGAGPGAEPDILYQGSGGTPADVSRKTGTTLGGFAITPTAADISTATGTYQTLMMKYNAANFAALELVSVPGIELRLGSSGTAYALYDTHGVDTYPAKGGFIIQAIDPNISGYRTSTAGSPAFNAADYFGIAMDFTATSKSENNVLSAIDVGAGLTLIGGDGVSADATWKDFSDFDAGTLANRYGYFTPLEGIDGFYGVFGKMVIGSATETDFTDSGVVTIFLDGFFAAGWSGVEIDLSNASSVFSNTNHTYDSRGNTTTTDTRATYEVTGTSGTATETNPTFKSFASITLNSAITFVGGSISDSGLVTVGGATINGVSVLSSTVAANASATLWNETTDPDGNMDDMVFTMGGNSHHAIEFGSSIPSSITLRGCNFSGFSASQNNNASIFHFRDTGGTITLNLIGCTSDVAFANSYRTDGATIDIVEDPVTTKITVEDSGGTSIENARVLVETADNGGGSGYPFEESVSITQTAGTATVTHTAHGLSTNDYIVIRGATEEEYNKTGQITVTGVNTYTYSVDSGATSPATGSPVSSYAPISGLTNISGIIQSSKTWPASQGLKGWARKKNISAPFYRDGDINIADASGGTNLLVTLQPDE